MSEIFLDQLLFTCVEPKYSPRNIGGYQIIRLSQGIAQDEKVQIVEIIKNYIVDFEQNIRFQFFPVGNERIVIARTVRVGPNKDILDSYGRIGFFTHAIVISKKDFSKFNNDPFIFIDNINFISRIEEIIDRFVREETGLAPKIKFCLVDDKSNFISNYTVDHLIPIINYFENNNYKKPTQLLVYGENKEIEKFYRNAFLISPVEARIKLFFDTNCFNNTKVEDVFWSIGSNKSENKLFSYFYSTINRSFSQEVQIVDKNELWSRWYKKIRDEGNISQLFRFLPEIRKFIFEFNEFQELSYQEYSSDGSIYLIKIYYSEIYERIIQNLELYTTKAVKDFVLSFLEQLVAIESKQIIKACSVPIDSVNLTNDLLLLCLRKKFPTEFLDNDWKKIASAAKKGNNLLLQFIAISAINKSNNIRSRLLVYKMSKKEYLSSLEWLYHPFQEDKYIERSKVQFFIDFVMKKRFLKGQILKIIVSLISLGHYETLNMIIPKLSELSLSELHIIYAKIRFNPFVPERFKLAIQANMEGQ